MDELMECLKTMRWPKGKHKMMTNMTKSQEDQSIKWGTLDRHKHTGPCELLSSWGYYKQARHPSYLASES